MIPRTSEESFVSLFRDARKARKSEPAALAERRRVRLADMVAHARAHSPAEAADPNQVWRKMESEIVELLREHKLTHVRIERAEEPPEQSPGGKYRTVVPLKEEGEQR